MKKFLLTLTAFVAVLSASAESLFPGGWEASYEPVSDAKELKGIHTAVAEDGAVYVSGTYNKAFTFAGKNVADPEGLTSASIVKYNEKGEEQWIVTMEGNAIVSAIDVDADGTLYAAGYFMDAVKYEGAEGISAELSGSADAYAAFVAKISKDGKFETVKVIASTANEEIVNSFMYFPMAGDVYVKPSNIQIDGDKVYVAANYAGDVAELSWKGAYINVFDFMYMDNRNVGVFSLNKSDLTGAANVATVQNTEVVSYVDFNAKAFDFVVDNGTVYVGFIGVGNLTLATSAEKKDFTFAKTDEGALEHAFVLAAIGETVATKVYNVALSEKLYTPYNLFMGADGENLIIGGTFSGELPFDIQKTSGELASDVFMASVKKADGATNWTYVSGKESEAIYAVTATNAVIATDSTVTFLNCATGEILKTDAVATLAADGCAAARAVVCASETKVMVSGELIAEETPEEAVPYKWTYDFESADENVKIIGAGSFVDDADAKFGKVFSNVGGAIRTNYLTLPDTVLAQSAVSKELTIGFWVNANGQAPSAYTYAPFFTAYASNTNGADNGFPMLALQSRGLAQVNCAGWTDFAETEHVNGKTNVYNQNAWEAGDARFNFVENWLEDNEWHYYTAVYTEAGLTIYLDGEVKNQWTCDGTEGKTLAGLFSNGGDLKHICLGGNQAWGWADGDSPFKFDDVMITNYVLTPEDIAAIISEKTATSGPSEEPVVDPDLIEIPQDQGKQYDTFARAELVEGEEYNTYTVNADLQIAFKMMDVDVKDCDYVVVKFAEPVAAGWKLAFWSNQDLVDVPEGATEFKYVFAEDSKCGVVNGVLPQICMMTFFGGFTAPLEAKVVGIYKHVAGVVDAIEDVEAAAPVNGKFIENGKIVIIKNGKKFNMAGVAIQ